MSVCKGCSYKCIPVALAWSPPIQMQLPGVWTVATVAVTAACLLSELAHCDHPQGSKLVLHAGDAEDPDIASDLTLLPDTETLADRPKPCLAEVQELPRDWARLFDGQLYSLGKQAGSSSRKH